MFQLVHFQDTLVGLGTWYPMIVRSSSHCHCQQARILIVSLWLACTSWHWFQETTYTYMHEPLFPDIFSYSLFYCSQARVRVVHSHKEKDLDARPTCFFNVKGTLSREFPRVTWGIRLVAEGFMLETQFLSYVLWLYTICKYVIKNPVRQTWHTPIVWFLSAGSCGKPLFGSVTWNWIDVFLFKSVWLCFFYTVTSLHSLELTWHLPGSHPKRKLIFQPSMPSGAKKS